VARQAGSWRLEPKRSEPRSTTIANTSSLAESYLYTTDAVKDFYGHLRDGGIINFSRFMLDGARMPRETLRLANIAATALRELGVDDPASHLLVFQGINWASTMIKRGRFTPAQVEALVALAEREGFQGLVFDPLAPAFTPEPSPGTATDTGVRRYFWTVLRGDEAERRAFERDYLYDISPTDDMRRSSSTTTGTRACSAAST
jgi:hypothetical protein